MLQNLLCFLLLFPASILAQGYELTGRVLDTDSSPLPGAHIALQYPWGDVVASAVSGSDGRFALSKVEPGGYKIVVSFLGFESLTREVNIKDQKIAMGDLALKSAAVELDQVLVEEKVPMAVQKGDTTQFNSQAFKTLPDATAEDLIEKMPGVVVEDGKVQAQGEDVKEVLVDGRPFFGNDPTAALRNLPAEVIDKIQIFDQASQQSQFTGFDDGETTKTINIITKKDMRNGQFGKSYAGFGTDERYRAGGNLSFFNGDQRISIIGQLNNINEQNFSTEDLLGVVGSNSSRGRGRSGGGRGRRGGGRGSQGASVNDFLIPQQGGIASTRALGINFSDRWGQKTELDGSYFFNQTDNRSLQDLQRSFFDDEEVSEIYSENTDSRTDNINHRLNLRLNHQIDPSNSILFQPRLSIQQNEGFSNTFGETRVDDEMLSQTDNRYQTDLSAVNLSNSLLYRHRFEKPRRTFSIAINSGFNPKQGENTLRSENIFAEGPLRMDTLDQMAHLDGQGWNWGARASYTEPLGKGMLMLRLNSSWRREDSEQEVFDWSETNGAYDELNEELSNTFTNDYLTHEASTGYNWRAGKWMLMARTAFQWAQLHNDQSFPIAAELDNNFYSVLPFAMIRFRPSRQENWRIMYRTSTQSPSLEQLQPVLNNSNPLQLSIGNPELDQSFQHRINARYSKTNTDKSAVLYAMLNATFTNKQIVNSLYLKPTANPLFDQLSLDPGVQLSRPVNLDGYWQLRSFFTYGRPVSSLKSNLNINLSFTYDHSPGLIDDQVNETDNLNLGAGVVLSSNISEQLDFTVSVRPSLNRVENSLSNVSNSDFYSQRSKIKLGWIVGSSGLVFRSALQHQFYNGLSADFDQNFWLWNASLGLKLFKNKLGEINLSVYDLLNQNNSVTRNVTEIYFEDSRVNVLQRYVMLNFIYNFRNFNTGKSKQVAPEKERRDRPPFF